MPRAAFNVAPRQRLDVCDFCKLVVHYSWPGFVEGMNMVGRSPHRGLLPLEKENAFQRLGNDKRWVRKAWWFGDP
jgi:hypothetical protein